MTCLACLVGYRGLAPARGRNLAPSTSARIYRVFEVRSANSRRRSISPWLITKRNDFPVRITRPTEILRIAGAEVRQAECAGEFDNAAIALDGRRRISQFFVRHNVTPGDEDVDGIWSCHCKLAATVCIFCIVVGPRCPLIRSPRTTSTCPSQRSSTRAYQRLIASLCCHAFSSACVSI